MHIKQQFVCWVFCPNFPKFVFRRRWGHLKAFKLLWRSMLRFHFSFYSYFSANQIELSPSQSLFSPLSKPLLFSSSLGGVNRLLASHVVHSGGSLVCLSCFQLPPHSEAQHTVCGVCFFPPHFSFFPPLPAGILSASGLALI